MLKENPRENQYILRALLTLTKVCVYIQCIPKVYM